MTPIVASPCVGAYNQAVNRACFKERVLGFRFSNKSNRPIDARRRAIAETNAFLSWAMKNPDQPVPRIPRRRIDRGGFSELLRRPNATTIVACWWAKALDKIRDH